LKIRLEESGNIGGAEIVKEYNEASERDQFLEKELTDLKNSAKSLEDLIANLDERLSVEFKSGLDCPYHCSFCGRNENVKYAKGTEVEGNPRFARLFDSMPEDSTISISGGLEPLTNPGLGERVRAAAVFRHLNKLVGESILQKQGVPPKVFYSIARSSRINRDYALDPAAEPIINERFLRISPDGILQNGKHAFIEWCVTRGIDPVSASTEYLSIVSKFDAYKKDGLIDATSKIKQAYHTVYLDKLYYLNFWTLSRPFSSVFF
jgi:hypothetical protein